MKSISISILFVSICLFGYSQNIKPDSKIIVDDPKLHQIIPENAQIEILAEGFEWSEGPLWLASESKVIFSDIPNNAIFEWSEKGGKKLFLKNSGYTSDKKRGGEIGSNALLLDKDGRLILCQHGDRRIARMNTDLKNPSTDFTTIIDKYQGKRLNSPNDATFHKNGDIYFTDPAYGLEFYLDDPAKEIDFQGVFKVDKNGEITLLTKELSCPNGIAFSPDYTKLYVANSDPEKAIWMVYDVAKNGLLKNGKVFFDATERAKHQKGLPDGMKVHPNGWIFASGPGGILIFTPDAKLLGTISTGEETANCAFNSDFTQLYITADNYLLRVKLIEN
ncbi:SMP-30/gluconolactonase/LRE family protein [Sunxiuqinia sp. A32]|uniref:SMP-30/gluconolactonase/LRE family protein n=1 Tax=Sunxiuqinia sp. A32 TaxID=3461496 RepID=UPI0040459F6C